MFVIATLYDENTGRISVCHYGEEETVKLNAIYYVLGHYDSETHYIDLSGDNPEPRERPAMPVTQDKTEITADGEDFITLAGLPMPCRVHIGSAEYDVPDGALEWSALMPAAYKIKAEAFPYLDWEGEVRAVASDVQAG